jgi:hypothetical protein
LIVDEVRYESIKISELDVKIQRLREGNKLQLSQLKENIEIFNKYFNLFSREIFIDFSLSFNIDTKSDTGEIAISVVNLDRVSGDGAPRAAALACDMAFVKYVKEMGAPFPEFTIQDYLEPSDQDKLAILFHIANKNNIQVVVSILKDKLASLSQEFIDGNSVLKLAKTDKFFKLN